MAAGRPRPVPRARRGREPVRRGARGRRPRHSATCGTAASTSTRTALAPRSARRWGTSTRGSSRRPTASRSSLRAPRHRSADRRDRAGRRGRHRPQRRGDDPRRRQQGGRRRDARGDAGVLAERRPHAGIELLFTSKEEVGLVGAYAFDHTRLRARTGYVYDQAAPIGDVILGAPYSQSLEVTLPRPRRARGHVSRGRPLGDRRRGPRDLRDAARADRRGLDRERRHDRRRHRDEHRPGVVHVRRRGALARRAEARRPGPGDAGRDHLRGRRRRLRRRDEGPQELPRLPLREIRPRRRARRGRAGGARGTP